MTREELVEFITHLAFCVGWPSAMSAMLRSCPRSPAFVLLARVLAMAPAQAQQQQPSPPRSKPMKIRLTLGDTVLTATLRDNPTVRPGPRAG